MTARAILTALLFLTICTTFESFGDATIRKALTEPTLTTKLLMFVGGGALLFGYGLFLNLAPMEFEKVVGLYIATLFVVWQVVSYFTFGAVPSAITLISAVLIIGGGCLLTFAR